MKRFFALILTLAIVLSFSACKTEKTNKNNTAVSTTNTESVITTSEAITPETSSETTENNTEEPDSKKITPLLYKVTDDKKNTIWLFGSIHVGKEYFYPLPDYVWDAYNNADALAVEFDMTEFESDMDAQMEAIQKLIYLDGTKIDDHLPEETYTKAVEILTELDVYNSLLDYYIPYMWATIIDNELVSKCGLDSELGIDMHFLNNAYENDKEIISVESAEFQYNMMANFSEELQVILLEESLECYSDLDRYKDDMATLLTLWENGNEKDFSEYLYAEGEFESKHEEALYKEYNDEMVVKRNLSMTDFAEDTLKSGKEVFICVGAAHIVGEGGMSGQLKDRGYTVEIVK